MAQARQIEVILVSELTRWGRSMLDLVRTLQDLQAWDLSLVAQSGLQFDLSTSQGKLIASVMAALAEFERDHYVNVSARESQRRALAEFSSVADADNG